MGQSTNAILFYGYVWDDETDLWDRDDHDYWFEAVAKRRGISSPWDFYRESGAEAQHNALRYEDQKNAYYYWKEQVGFEALLAEWDAAKDAIKAEHPSIDVGSHCSCDFPMPYIFVSDTKQNASRGYPVAVDTDKVSDTRPEWDEALTAFVTDLDIDISEAQGPGWFLVSNWC